MKQKSKKIFAIFMMPIVFSNSFPFLKAHLKKKEENPDIVQSQHSIGGERNVFISGLTATFSTSVTASIKNVFKK